MIAENPGDGAPTSAVVSRIDPAQYPLTEMDRHELMVKRGFTAETIATARLGSIRSQTDLENLGLDWTLDDLPSTIIVPYGPPDANGLCLFRLHKRSLPGMTYPPYVALPRRETDIVIVTEAEFKALAVWQLGYNAIGLQGTSSHIHRIDELVAAIEFLGSKRVYIGLDTVRPRLECDHV